MYFRQTFVRCPGEFTITSAKCHNVCTIYAALPNSTQTSNSWSITWPLIPEKPFSVIFPILFCVPFCQFHVSRFTFYKEFSFQCFPCNNRFLALVISHPKNAAKKNTILLKKRPRHFIFNIRFIWMYFLLMIFFLIIWVTYDA